MSVSLGTRPLFFSSYRSPTRLAFQSREIDRRPGYRYMTDRCFRARARIYRGEMKYIGSTSTAGCPNFLSVFLTYKVSYYIRRSTPCLYLYILSKSGIAVNHTVSNCKTISYEGDDDRRVVYQNALCLLKLTVTQPTYLCISLSFFISQLRFSADNTSSWSCHILQPWPQPLSLLILLFIPLETTRAALFLPLLFFAKPVDNMHTNICNLICASVFGAAASASLLAGAANTYMCVYNRERELDTIFSADLGRDEPLEMLYRLDEELKEILFLGYENFF